MVAPLLGACATAIATEREELKGPDPLQARGRQYVRPHSRLMLEMSVRVATTGELVSLSVDNLP